MTTADVLYSLARLWTEIGEDTETGRVWASMLNRYTDRQRRDIYDWIVGHCIRRPMPATVKKAADELGITGSREASVPSGNAWTKQAEHASCPKCLGRGVIAGISKLDERGQEFLWKRCPLDDSRQLAIGEIRRLYACDCPAAFKNPVKLKKWEEV